MKLKKEVHVYIERYIEIITLFDLILSLEIVIEKTLSCWRHLQLSTEMVKIYEIKIIYWIKKQWNWILY